MPAPIALARQAELSRAELSVVEPLDGINGGIDQPACRAVAVSDAFYPVRARPLRVQPTQLLLRHDVRCSRLDHL
jgi:hypothetical protein